MTYSLCSGGEAESPKLFQEEENLFNLLTTAPEGEKNVVAPISQEESPKFISSPFSTNPVATMQCLQGGGSMPLSSGPHFGLSEGAGLSGLRRIVPSSSSRSLGLGSPLRLALSSSEPVDNLLETQNRRRGKRPLSGNSQEKAISLERKSSSSDEGA